MRYPGAVLCAFLFCCSMCGAQSSSPTWLSTNGPLHDTIVPQYPAALAIDGAGTIVECGNSVGRYARGGAAWSIVDSFPAAVYHQVLLLSNGATLAVSTDGVSVSRDSGRTWRVTLPRSTVGDVCQIAGVDSLVFAATSVQLFRSDNWGVAWQRVDFKPQVITSIAMTDSVTVLALDDTAIFRSTDRGGTWMETTPCDGRGGGGLVARGALAFGPIAGESMLRSTDGGVHWHTIHDNFLRYVGSMMIVDSATILAFSFHGTSGLLNQVYRSIDSGVQWQRVDSSIAGYDTVTSIITCAGTDGHGRAVFANPVLYATDDGGLTWIALPALTRHQGIAAHVNGLVLAPDQSLYAFSPISGIYRTTDEGKEWSATSTDLPTSTIFALGFDPFGMWYIATDSGVYRSTDRGGHAVRRNNGLFTAKISAFAFNEIGNVFVASDSGFFRSFDNGVSWEARDTGLAAGGVLSLIATDSGDLYAGTYQGVYHSTDRGDTWQVAGAGLDLEWVHALAINANGDLFAGTELNGVYRLRSKGTLWEPLMNDLPLRNVSALAFDSTTRLVAATDKGAYRLVSDSGGWQHMDYPVPGGTAPTIGLIADAHDKLFTTIYGTVFVAGTALAIASPSDPAPESLVLFPSPARDDLSVVIHHSGHAVHVSMIDGLGRAIRSRTIGDAEGESSVWRINLDGVVQGVYRIVVSGARVRQTRAISVIR